jgi:hypothetical protein
MQLMLFAQRRLTISSPSGDIDVPVRVFQPEQEDSMWICRYEIDWPNERKSYFGAGVDGMQALILALRTICTELYTSEYHEAGTLRWFEAGRGYGFPAFITSRDLLIGDDVKDM